MGIFDEEELEDEDGHDYYENEGKQHV